MFYALKTQSRNLQLSPGDTLNVGKLFHYVDKNWITSSLWPPYTWSVFLQPIRTNNDAEGWHTRINGRAGQNGLNFYLLVESLYQESRNVPLQVTLLAQETLTRRQRGKTEELQGNLFLLWDEFTSGKLSSRALLENCATLYCEYNKLRFNQDADDARYDYSSEEEE